MENVLTGMLILIEILKSIKSIRLRIVLKSTPNMKIIKSIQLNQREINQFEINLMYFIIDFQSSLC